MVEYMRALECIGCGRLEGPRPCIGVCQDQVVELVYASDYKELLARAEGAERQVRMLKDLARQLAWTTPHHGAWERSYRTLQAQARGALGTALTTGTG